MNVKNSLFVAFVFMLLGTAFAGYVPYKINYISSITLDGSPPDWDSAPVEKLYKPDGTVTYSYFKMAYTLDPSTKSVNYLACGFFFIYDNTNDMSKDFFRFNYNAVDADFALKFTRAGSVYDGNGQEVPLSTGYDYKKLEYDGGWRGEFCIPYSYVGIKAGEMMEFGPVLFWAIDFSANQINYKWPKPSAGLGTLNSSDKWLPPGYCKFDDNCHDAAFCSNSKCTAVPQGECGYVSGHNWSDYQCCSDTICGVGNKCVDNKCTSSDSCVSDIECSDSKYCVQTAVGGLCKDVPVSKCGYVADHKWTDYECCSDFACDAGGKCIDHSCVAPSTCTANTDCKSDEYCVFTDGVNKCSPVPETSDCGYADNHQWNNYQCCDSTDCIKGKICVSNLCKSASYCMSDLNCKDSEYCAPTALGNQCMPVQQGGSCGYVGVHKWNNYQCCKTSDCLDTQYCSDNKCLSVPEGTCGYVADHSWNEYECCTDANCPSGTKCDNYVCSTGSKECQGNVVLSIYYTNSEKKTIDVVLDIIKNCNEKTGYIRKNDCNGDLVCSIGLTSIGASCTFPAPSDEGVYKYAGCVDISGDGVYSDSESDVKMFNISGIACKSSGCTPETWSGCTYEGANATGYKSGRCVDNCNMLLEMRTECSGARLPPVTSQGNRTTIPADGVVTTPQKPDSTLLTGAIILLVVIIAAVFMLLRPKSGPKQK